MKVKIGLVLLTCLGCLALTACKVENKEGDTVVPAPVKKETSSTTVIDKPAGDSKSDSTTSTTTTTNH